MLGGCRLPASTAPRCSWRSLRAAVLPSYLRRRRTCSVARRAPAHPAARLRSPRAHRNKSSRVFLPHRGSSSWRARVCFFWPRTAWADLSGSRPPRSALRCAQLGRRERRGVPPGGHVPRRGLQQGGTASGRGHAGRHARGRGHVHRRAGPPFKAPHTRAPHTSACLARLLQRTGSWSYQRAVRAFVNYTTRGSLHP